MESCINYENLELSFNAGGFGESPVSHLLISWGE